MLDYAAFLVVEGVRHGPGGKQSVDTKRRKKWRKERKGV